MKRWIKYTALSGILCLLCLAAGTRITPAKAIAIQHSPVRCT
jgi:hypothetical protein